MNVLIFYVKWQNQGWIFNATEHIVSSTFFRIDQHVDFTLIVAKSATLHENVVQNDRIVCWAISESVRNSVLISSQNSFDDLYKTQVSNSNCVCFYIKHSNIAHSKDI